MQQSPDQHLGDGVYVSCDGHHVWIAVNHHKNRVVALDPWVTEAMIKYLEGVRNGSISS